MSGSPNRNTPAVVIFIGCGISMSVLIAGSAPALAAIVLSVYVAGAIKMHRAGTEE